MPSDPPSPLDATAADLRLATFRLARHLRAARAVDTMSDAQFAVLAALRVHGRQTLGGLADRERVTAPSMTRTVNCLADEGYVTRTPDDEDRRRVHVEITPEGERVVAETIRRRDASLAASLAELDLTDAELETLRSASELMRRLAER